VIPVEEQNRRLAAYLQAAPLRERAVLDNCRVLLRGAFCEPPPPALLVTLERSGCDVVDDDLVLVTRYITQDVDESVDPWDGLASAFLEHAVSTSSLYGARKTGGEALVEAVHRSGAEGVVFAAPSFCDPALLDQPMLAAACDRAGIAHTAFKYAEDMGQLQSIREQAGTFADSIKLWGEA
jgi:benzoyl-CoA reductase subunit C